MNYRDHRARWNDCTACSLCEKRRHVVLYRGSLPADILFCGEAPGFSENDLGQPFTGPAGQLLDLIIARALMTRKVSIGFTNLVACVPLDEDGQKTVEPPTEAIAACQERLIEIVRLANPKGVVFVGKLAEKYFPPSSLLHCYITHPAAILRAEKQNQGLLSQSCIISIRDLVDDLKLGV